MAPPPALTPAPLQTKVEVPSFFRCPISLDLMIDPVSLCTGMTYDRASIERWLDDGNLTCPATMQRLTSLDLVPNHTLRRLIQDWCVANRSKGVQRIPTPRQPATPAMVRAMLDDIAAGTATAAAKLKTLRKLRLLYKESDKNKTVIQAAGVVQVLTDALLTTNQPQLWEEAVGLLALLPTFHDYHRRRLAGHKHLAVAAWILQHGGMEARVNAATVLEHIALTPDDHPSTSGEHQAQAPRSLPTTFDPFKIAVGSTRGVMSGLVQLLQGDQLYAKAVKAGLRCLLAVCGARGSRVKAVEAGAVPALVELLLHAPDNRPTTTTTRGSGAGAAGGGSPTAASNAECAIAVLELLCSCAEGRAAVNAHAMAVPSLVTSLLTISDTATECAVGALWAICQFSPDYINNNGNGAADVLELAVEAGVFTKLILLMQADFTALTKTRAAALMRLLGDIWRNSPCSADHGLAHIKPY